MSAGAIILAIIAILVIIVLFRRDRCKKSCHTKYIVCQNPVGCDDEALQKEKDCYNASAKPCDSVYQIHIVECEKSDDREKCIETAKQDASECRSHVDLDCRSQNFRGQCEHNLFLSCAGAEANCVQGCRRRI